MMEIYRDMACKLVFPDFECWFADMLKSGVFEKVKQRSIETIISYGGVENGRNSRKEIERL